MGERGNDRRTAYTRMVIREAFFDLMREKGFAKMSVAEICKRAGINRGTFYLHFEDKYALLASLIDEALDSSLPVEGTPSTMCQRPPRTQDDRLLYTDPATAPVVAQHIIERNEFTAALAIAKQTGLSEHDAAILFAHIVHGNLAVNQTLGWKGDADFSKAQVLIARFVEGGLASLSGQ